MDETDKNGEHSARLGASAAEDDNQSESHVEFSVGEAEKSTLDTDRSGQDSETDVAEDDARASDLGTEADLQESGGGALPADRVIGFGVFSMLFGLGLFVLWAVFVPLAEGVVAFGTVAVEGKRKIVQHLEGGIISTINVREGDKVDAGDVLIELDTTQNDAQRSDIRSRYLGTLAKLDRLVAEQQGRDKIEWNQDLIDSDDPVAASSMQLQENSFTDNLSQLTGQIEILNQRIDQYKEQIRGLETQVAARQNELSILSKDIDRTTRLSQQNLVDRGQLLALQREKLGVQAEVGRLHAEIAITRVRITEAGESILQARRDYRKESGDQISENQETIYTLRERLRIVDDILTRTKILAPQTGRVLGMASHTVGGVISPASAVLELVPTNNALLIEAKIEPLDIDRVNNGSEAELRFSSFSSNTTPSVTGVVTNVSADAFTDPNTSAVYYLADVSVSDKEADKLEGLEVVPGMPVEVMILGGSRTAAEYLLEPLTDVVRRSLRE